MTEPKSGYTSVRFENILFTTDFSQISEKALPYAAAIARRFGATLYVSYVIPSESYAHIPQAERDTALAAMNRDAEERISGVLASSCFKGISHQAVIDHGDFWPILSSIADTYAVDLIAAGTHGRHGLEKLVSGSVAEEIFLVAKRPVLLIGPEVMIAAENEVQIQRILFATDFSSGSRRAMDYAYALAKAYSAHLYFMHVAEDVWAEPLSTRMPPEAFFRQRFLERGWPENEEGIEPEFLVEFGSAETLTLEAAAKKDIHLIIVNAPTTSHPDMAAHLPGPLAYNIVSHARCPVLSVRGVEEHASSESATPSAAA